MSQGVTAFKMVEYEATPLMDIAKERLDELLLYHERSFQFALRCCRGSPEEAEDILQQAYTLFLDGAWESYRGEAELKTWWFGIIRKLSLGFLRKLARRSKKLLSSTLEVSQEPPSPEAQAATRERERKINKLIYKLPEKQRLTLHLYYYEEMSITEIANVLGVSSRSTIQSRLELGRKELEKLLKKEGIQ